MSAGNAPGSASDAVSPRRQRAGRLTEIMIVALLVAALALFLAASFGKTSAFAQASSGRGPYFFPRIVLGGMAILIPVLLVGIRQRAALLPERAPLVRMIFVILATAAYCAAIGVIGFLLASVLFGGLVPVLLGQRGYLMLAAIALSYAVAVWLLFEKIFLIILPASPFGLGF